LAELVIALTDLLEAEGRALRKSVLRTGVGLACLGVASLLLLLGLGLCLWGVYLWLAVLLEPAAAAALIGVVSLLLAGGLAWMAIRLGR
jgi:hypothetical protein